MFVLPGEPGHEGDNAWEDLEEEEAGGIEGHVMQSETNEVCVTPNDKQNKVTPRVHRKRTKKTFSHGEDETHDDNKDDDETSEDGSLAAFQEKYMG